MLHHNPQYIAATEADRRARASAGRASADAAALEATLLAAARGDDAGWSVLVRRFSERVRAAAVRHRLPAHDVDDVLQSTWLRLLEHIGSVREPGALGAWLDTTASRESLRVIRGAVREMPTDEALRYHEVDEPVDERELVEVERRAALATSVERLPANQQKLISMLLAHPTMTYSQISKALDTPIGSIGPTRGRALARLSRDPELLRAIGHGG